MPEVARAQRFPIAMRVLWRPRGVTQWFEAKSVNASRSGVFFRSEACLAVGTEVELLLAMGYEDVTSVDVADVFCVGSIVRTEMNAAPGAGSSMAATIDSYSFLREP